MRKTGLWNRLRSVNERELNLLSEEIIHHRVSLYIWSKILYAEEIGDALGLPFSRKHTIGDKRSKSPILVFTDNFWILDSKLDAKRPFKDHIQSLINIISSYEKGLNEIRSSCGFQCTCISEGKSLPMTTFDSDLLLNLGRLGFSLDLDLYVFPDE